MEVGAFFLRAVCPGYGGQLKLCGEQRTQEVRFFVPKPPFREISDEQALVVNDERNAHLVFELAENVANDRVQQKLTKLVLNGRNGLTLKARVIAFVLIMPKRADERVFDLANNTSTVFSI